MQRIVRQPITCIVICIAGLFLQASASCAADMSGILATVDERIEKHRKRDAAVQLVLPDGSVPVAGSSVRIQLTKHRFHFGGNFFAFGEATGVEEASYRERFSDVMNLAVLPFYWHTYEPQRGRTLTNRWMDAANWCQQNNITTKGHPLVWNMEPKWVSRLQPSESEQLLWGRVVSEVGNFRGRVDMWDVINETTEGMKYAQQRSATGLLNVYQKYGISRVTKHAFDLAREANPNATLVLNDYETTDQFVNTIRRAQKIGTQIDAIGLQSHMHTGYWGAAKIWDVCDRFGQFGIPVHFTELTILSGRLKSEHDHDWETKQTNWQSTPRGEQAQAEQVRELYHLLFSHPSVEAIVWWDLTDKHAWMGAPGGLLRKDFSPKPAYFAIRDLVKKGWTTSVRTTIDEVGQANIRGFFGDYAVSLTTGDRVYHGDFAIDKKDVGPIQVRLR